jgi:prevent-host-death family protein
VNIYEAKTQLSKLVKRARAGEEIIIADAGTPVAKLVPFDRPSAPRVLGTDRGRVKMTEDAFSPLSEDDLALWEGPLLSKVARRKRTSQVKKRRT